MTEFSANLGFLWNDLALPDAIRAAKDAGFNAVECHCPYDTPVEEIANALDATGLRMLGINTLTGEGGGFAALAGGENDMRNAINQAIDYGRQINVKHVHVLSGPAHGEDAHRCYVDNLRYAATRAQEHKIDIVIEPLNPKDAPGNFINSTSQAAAIIGEVNLPNLRLMFDCYHVQLIEGNLTNRITELLPIIGHIQFASVPDRGPPDAGEVNYRHIFQHLKNLGWSSPLGAEFRPDGATASSLDWLSKLGA
jgi:hydroxypyruvate isomerase